MHHRYREMMAACAMLVVLAGLVIPVWGAASAARSDCMASVQDIARAALRYADDYDRVLPRTYYGGDGNHSYDPNSRKLPDGASDYAWAWALLGYTSNQFITCKAYPEDQYWDGRTAPRADATGISYGYNMRLGEVGYELARLSHPAQTLLLFDLAPNLIEPWAGLPDTGTDPHLGSLGNVEERVRANHFGPSVRWNRPGDAITGVAIVGFCDGHVQAMRKAPLLATGPGRDGNLWDPER